MSKHIVVVESPAKAKTIEKYLGKDYTVLASYGHVRDLPSKDGSVDVDNDFAMHYKVAKDSEKNIKAILNATKTADTLYLATDLDREGEAISWHVWEEVKDRLGTKAKNVAVKRIAFAEITKSAIQNAVAHPRELNQNLIDAQQARRALDYLVGFNLSPVLWRKVRGGLSAGRVQSVALRLICEREDAIEQFKPEEYWSIEGDFAAPSGDIIAAKLHTLNGEKLEKFSVNNETSATEAVNILEKQNYSLTSIEKKQTRRNPSAPFITSTLQQEAARKLGFSARKTMSTAQRLYEAGHITYMRTDSVNLALEALNAIRGHIGKKYGADFVAPKIRNFASKSKNAQEAHEAIRPTDITREALGVEADQQKLYDLIWKRTIACQMASAVLDLTALTIGSADGKHAFRATGSIVTFPGFMQVYIEGRDDVADEEDNLLPDVPQDAPMDLRELRPEQHFTEPPPRFSEASLVKALEEYEIGRPSTYASIIATIQDRGYVRQEKRRFYPEDVGRIVNKFLTEHFAKYVDYNFTANMEEDLDAVARGEREWKPLLRDFWSPFKATVDDKIESVRKSEVTAEETDEVCPTCNEGKLTIRLGRYGRFKGCNRYPECKHTEPLEGKAESEGGAAKAGSKPTGVTCPKCKENEIVERTSRRGKVFYGCSGYPKCQYALWDKPVAEPCPSCNWPLITEKETKRTGLVRKCPQDDCNWQDPPATEKETKAKAKTAAKGKAPAKKAPAKKKAAPRKKSA